MPDTPAEPVKRKRGRPRLNPPYLSPSQSGASTTRDTFTRITQLEKNRIAADKCRRRKKKYTAKLVTEHSSVHARNANLKADVADLREQVLVLRHKILQHAKCGSWMIDGYVTRVAGDLSGAAGLHDSVVTPPSTLSSNEANEATKAEPGYASGPHLREGDADFAVALEFDDDLWLLDHDDCVLENQQDP